MNSVKFSTLPLGDRFGLYPNSKLIYEKKGQTKALIVHQEAYFYIGLSKRTKVYPKHKAP